MNLLLTSTTQVVNLMDDNYLFHSTSDLVSQHYLGLQLDVHCQELQQHVLVAVVTSQL